VLKARFGYRAAEQIALLTEHPGVISRTARKALPSEEDQIPICCIICGGCGRILRGRRLGRMQLDPGPI
jgi:hypothetical protein